MVWEEEITRNAECKRFPSVLRWGQRKMKAVASTEEVRRTTRKALWEGDIQEQVRKTWKSPALTSDVTVHGRTFRGGGFIGRAPPELGYSLCELPFVRSVSNAGFGETAVAQEGNLATLPSRNSVSWPELRRKLASNCYDTEFHCVLGLSICLRFIPTNISVCYHTVAECFLVLPSVWHSKCVL